MKKISYFILAFAACVLAGCHSHNEDAHGHDHSAEEEHAHSAEKEDEDGHEHANEIVFTNEQAAAAQVKVDTVRATEFQSVIKTSGEIQSQPGDEHTVVATSSGIVNYTNSSITEGSAVSAGSVIVSISAEKIYDGDPVVKARLAFEAAEKEFKRAERLVVDKIISEKEYEQIKMKYETARAAYIGQSKDLTSRGVQVKSPIGGYIKSRIVANGEFVNVGQPIAVVTRNKRLQLRADVSENDYAQLRNVNGANFKTTYDNKVHRLADLNGRLVSYARTSSGGASYIPVTFEFDNVGDILPGAYAEVYLLSGRRDNVITLPIEAVTEEQGLYFVYVREHEEAYMKRQVTLGQDDGKRIEILSGLKEGESVVTRGAYQVKMASAKAEIPGHTH